MLLTLPTYSVCCIATVFYFLKTPIARRSARLLDERVAGAQQVREGRAVGDDAVQAVLLQRLCHSAKCGLHLGQRAIKILLRHLRTPTIFASS